MFFVVVDKFKYGAHSLKVDKQYFEDWLNPGGVYHTYLQIFNYINLSCTSLSLLSISRASCEPGPRCMDVTGLKYMVSVT